jgi:hypothetical protein
MLVLCHVISFSTEFYYYLQYGFEQLFAQYGVDLEIWAHEHSYERMWPVYNMTVGHQKIFIDEIESIYIGL